MYTCFVRHLKIASSSLSSFILGSSARSHSHLRFLQDDADSLMVHLIIARQNALAKKYKILFLNFLFKPLKADSAWGWRGGSAARSTCYSFRRVAFGAQHLLRVAQIPEAWCTSLNSCLCGQEYTHGAHTYTQPPPNTHKIKYILFLENC